MPSDEAVTLKPTSEEVTMAKVPYPLDYEFGNAYHAFVYGPTKHILLSSYSNFDPGSIQYEWLVDELESVDTLHSVTNKDENKNSNINNTTSNPTSIIKKRKLCTSTSSKISINTTIESLPQKVIIDIFA